jgi:hypothetical protein
MCLIKIIIFRISEKSNGEYKLPASSSDEVWEIRTWPQTDSEDIETGQSQACHNC